MGVLCSDDFSVASGTSCRVGTVNLEKPINPRNTRTTRKPESSDPTSGRLLSTSTLFPFAYSAWFAVELPHFRFIHVNCFSRRTEVRPSGSSGFPATALHNQCKCESRLASGENGKSKTAL